jgi:hypothetical protein
VSDLSKRPLPGCCFTADEADTIQWRKPDGTYLATEPTWCVPLYLDHGEGPGVCWAQAKFCPFCGERLP